MDSPFGDLADFSLLDVLMLARLAALLEYRAVKWIEDMGIEQPFPDLIFLHESLPKSTSNENDVLATYFSAVLRNCTAHHIKVRRSSNALCETARLRASSV